CVSLAEVPERCCPTGQSIIKCPGKARETAGRVSKIAFEICTKSDRVKTGLRHQRAEFERFQRVALTIRHMTIAGQGKTHQAHTELVIWILHQCHISFVLIDIEIPVAVEL